MTVMTRFSVALLVLLSLLSVALASPLPLLLGAAALVVLGSELLTDTGFGS